MIHRLDTSFDTVLFEVQNILKQCGENSTNGQATPNFNTSIYGNEVASNTNQSRIGKQKHRSLHLFPHWDSILFVFSDVS